MKLDDHGAQLSSHYHYHDVYPAGRHATKGVYITNISRVLSVI